jgi:hypothetical protein
LDLRRLLEWAADGPGATVMAPQQSIKERAGLDDADLFGQAIRGLAVRWVYGLR